MGSRIRSSKERPPSWQGTPHGTTVCLLPWSLLKLLAPCSAAVATCCLLRPRPLLMLLHHRMLPQHMLVPSRPSMRQNCLGAGLPPDRLGAPTVWVLVVH